MSDSPSSSIGRSIAAVVAGFVTIAVLSMGADVLLRQAMPGAFAPGTGRVDDPRILLLMIAYVGLFAVFGCWLTARLAPSRPMRHALILGALGLVLNVGGSIAMWDTAPAWYHVVSMLLVMPYAWLGGRIRERQLAQGEGRPGVPSEGAIA
jgi:hypothetical protein